MRSRLVFSVSYLPGGVLYISVTCVGKRNDKEDKMKSALNGVAVALAIMAATLSAKRETQG